jgi:hypothetical protein
MLQAFLGHCAGVSPFEGLLHLLMPATSKHAANLHILLTGDTASDNIEWRCPGGVSAVEVKQYAEMLAHSLMPHRFEIFSRTRWLGSVAPLTGAALLADIHNLLPRAIIAWCNLGLAPIASIQVCEAAWDGLPSDDDVSDKDREILPGAWAAWNRKQQRDSKKFAMSRPAGVLLMSSFALQPNVRLQRAVQYLDGDVWQRHQLYKACAGQPYRTRIEHVASLAQTHGFYEDCESLLGPDARWDLLLERHTTVDDCNTDSATDGFRTLGFSSQSFSIDSRTTFGTVDVGRLPESERQVHNRLLGAIFYIRGFEGCEVQN